jgi:hypothetical protein
MSEVEMRRLEILDECLSQIQSGEATISDCLSAYPDHKHFLESQLSIALQTRELLSPPQPSEEFISQTKIRLLNQIHAKQSKSQQTKPKETKGRLGFLRPKLAYISLIIALALLISGLGVASASASALPGDLLYNVKLGIEETRLFISQDPTSDADLLIHFADTRLDEVLALADTSRDDDVALALAGYEDIVSKLIDLTEDEKLTGEDETLNKIHYGLDHHQEVLQGILQRALEKATLSGNTLRGLQNAIQKSGHGKEIIEYKQNGGSPSDLAPGQNKTPKPENENQGGSSDNRGGENDPDRTPGPPPSKTPKDKNNDQSPDRPPTKTPKPTDN